MPLRSPSLQALSRVLGLSRTTVSDALRGKGRVSDDTVARVKAQARAMGYRPNPLVATVLGSINRGRGTGYRGALAMVDIFEENHWPHGPFPRELIAGAKARASEMGFSIAEFVVGRDMSWQRLNSILEARGIHGVIVLPAWGTPDLSQLNWSKYAGIYLDVHASPELHSVCSDHYGSMLSLLARLKSRGYRRPGLILQHGRDERIGNRHTAAFNAFGRAEHSHRPIPPLITNNYPDFGLEFAPWFRRHRPDVVLSHFGATRDWIKQCDPRSEVGIVLLNILDRTYDCAALDLQPRTLGARAVELVIGQILRNELGIPEWPSRTTVEARWVEGPTIRSDSVATPDGVPAAC